MNYTSDRARVTVPALYPIDFDDGLEKCLERSNFTLCKRSRDLAAALLVIDRSPKDANSCLTRNFEPSRFQLSLYRIMLKRIVR